jgi:membrane-associated phospholipid phosphatase
VQLRDLVRLPVRRPWVGFVFVLGMLSLWGFAQLVEELVTADSMTRTDAEVATWLHGRAVADGTPLAGGLTELGGPPALILITLTACALLLWRRRRDDAVLVAVAFAGAGILNWALKAVFARPRPSFTDPLVTDGGSSFPSGHAMISIAVYGALTFVLAHRLGARGRLGLLSSFGALTLAIGFTRLYLGAHYLSDVLAGFSAGLAWLALCVLALTFRRVHRAQRLSAATA